MEWFVKDNNIILRGKRNRSDGLWDIPIEKTTITENNFEHPSMHTALYKNNNIGHTTQAEQKMTRTLHRTKQIKDGRNNNVETMPLKSLEKILANQHKQDFNNYSAYTAANLTNYNKKLVVIIRKKQTHQDLARYLHAACFSPVTWTWTKAITNNNFI